MKKKACSEENDMKKKNEEDIDDDINEDVNDEDEMSDEDEDDTEKSVDLTEDDLSKSIAKLSEYAEQGDAPTRKQALLQKAQTSELTKSEQNELHEILGGGQSKQSNTLSDEIEKSMEPGEDLQKALDVSDFLRDTHEQSIAVNKMLAATIEKSDHRQHEFNLLLAKSTAQIGNLVKSIDERLSAYENQPARAPKSKVLPLQKSFAGTPPSGEHLSKSEVLNTMSALIEKSCNAGQGGVVDGVDMIMEATKYEQYGNMSPAALELVKQQKGTAVH